MEFLKTHLPLLKKILILQLRNDFGVKVESVEKYRKVSIADADIVVSAGRGLKGRNWE
jgi:electron transfer flavoprotein alpha subunit